MTFRAWRDGSFVKIDSYYIMPDEEINEALEPVTDDEEVAMLALALLGT